MQYFFQNIKISTLKLWKYNKKIFKWNIKDEILYQ